MDLDEKLQQELRRYVGQVVHCVLYEDVTRAIKYVSPKQIIKATRRGKKNRKNRHIEMVLSIGKPNWAERKFIKKARIAKEPFPIKKIQLEWK